jgi:hypothetical protein
LMHWMSVTLPENFQMSEHSLRCRFHINNYYRSRNSRILYTHNWPTLRTSYHANSVSSKAPPHYFVSFRFRWFRFVSFLFRFALYRCPFLKHDNNFIFKLFLFFLFIVAGVCPFHLVASFKFGNHKSNVKFVERRGIKITEVQ